MGAAGKHYYFTTEAFMSFVLQIPHWGGTQVSFRRVPGIQHFT
jgi:hypothetical protein